MKIFFPILFIMVTGQTLSAQTADSVPRQHSKVPAKSFVDQDGDGINDVPPQGKKRLRDKFVDTNGDGICDSREQGLGFKRSGRAPGAGAGSDNKQKRGGRR